MRRMVKFNCISTWLVWEGRDLTGAQYSAAEAPEQMTAVCLRWHPRWNRLASSTSCFGSSACLQSLSSVLCRTAYGLESHQDRLGSNLTLTLDNNSLLQPSQLCWLSVCNSLPTPLSVTYYSITTMSFKHWLKMEVCAELTLSITTT